jgi:hypothetical protein
MTNVIDRIKAFITTIDGLNAQVGAVVNSLVQKNIEDYLDTLADVSPEEEARMYGRTLRQSDVTDNKKFRDRLNAFKDVNKDIKQKTGNDVIDLETLQNPLRTALVDDSILQLYKLANEIALLIKNGKIDGPALGIIVEKAVDSAIRDASIPEIQDMLSQLVTRVEDIYYENFKKEIDPEIDKYISTVIDGVISGRGTT